MQVRGRQVEMKELKALVVNEAGEILGCSTKDLPQLSNVNFLILLTNPSSTFRSELHVNHIISVPQFPFSQKQIYVFFFTSHQTGYLQGNICTVRKCLKEKSPEIVSTIVVRLKYLSLFYMRKHG